MTIPIPANIIGINKVVRTSRQILQEIGGEPTPEELAEKVTMPRHRRSHRQGRI